MLLDIEDKTLLIDCGMDIKHSLKAANRKVEEIDGVYISHLHGDHSLGLEWLAFYNYFITKKKVDLYICKDIFDDLWSILEPSLSRHKDSEFLFLKDYFNIFKIDKFKSFVFGGENFYVNEIEHVRNVEFGNHNSYGLVCYREHNKEHRKWQENIFYISTDTVENNSFDAKYIFHDCDVMNLNGVHANYNDLKNNNKDRIRKNMWLYHYHDLGEEMPNAVTDGFAGFVKEGQIFEF